MDRLRFVIIGSGWRSLYYVRIALALPQEFELIGMAVRSETKKALIRSKYPIRVSTDQEELLAEKPDFVVVAVDRNSNAQVCAQLLTRGFAVLAETPPADDLPALKRLWGIVESEGAKLQIAEQYFLYPTYAAKIAVAQSGLLGAIHAVSISALHEYHAFSIIRKLLGNGRCPVSISAKKYTYPVTDTDGRYGMIIGGPVKEQKRVRAELAFADGKLAFYDFSDVQYHSYIRSRHLNVQGTEGEIDDNLVSYVEKDGYPHREPLIFERREDAKGIDRVLLGGRAVYTNPFPIGLLTEDESAIALLMRGMRGYLAEGKEVYPVADAFEDAYLTVLLNEAIAGGPAVYERQDWNRE